MRMAKLKGQEFRSAYTLEILQYCNEYGDEDGVSESQNSYAWNITSFRKSKSCCSRQDKGTERNNLALGKWMLKKCYSVSAVILFYNTTML